MSDLETKIDIMNLRKKRTLYIVLSAVLLINFAIVNNARALTDPEERSGSGLNMGNAIGSKWLGALHDNTSDAIYEAKCHALNYKPLLSAYAQDPCLSSTLDPTYGQLPGGAILTDALDDWWIKDGFPKVKGVASQISAFFMAQTQMLAVSEDASNVADFIGTKQEEEYKTRQRYMPNEYSCVVSSNISALSKAYTVSEEMTEGYKRLLERRNTSAKGSESKDGPLADVKKRWDNYCQYFNDPDANGGVNSCANPQTAGSAQNGDIDIEGLMLKDTIDMTDTGARKAAEAIIFNLVQPKIDQRLLDTIKDSVSGRETIIKMQHMSAVRNIAAHVISSIIARRAPVSKSNVSGLSSGTLIGEIRKNAGINAEDISANPSYNEIMLAMTKERFMDPTYYIRVQDTVPAIVKEQATLEAYVNLQLTDIYKLQEQINILLAARNSFKAEASQSKGGQVDTISTENADDEDYEE